MADHRFKNANPLKAGNYWQRYIKQMPLIRELTSSEDQKLQSLHKSLGIEVSPGKKGVNLKFRK